MKSLATVAVVLTCATAAAPAASPAFRHPNLVARALERFYSNQRLSGTNMHVGKLRCTPAAGAIRCLSPGSIRISGRPAIRLRLVWHVTKINSHTAHVVGEMFDATTGSRYSTSGLGGFVQASSLGLTSW